MGHNARIFIAFICFTGFVGFIGFVCQPGRGTIGGGRSPPA
jgi:hypothetical protein